MFFSVVQLTDTVKLLGVTIDRHQTFLTHMYRTYASPRIITYDIRALKHIRSSLSTDMAKTVASALANSRLDSANSVLYNTSSVNMLKLQRVQNSLARVGLLHQLHWLPGFRSTTVSTTRLTFLFLKTEMRWLKKLKYDMITR